MNLVSTLESLEENGTAQIMANEPNQTPEGNEVTPTPEGTEGEETPEKTPSNPEGSPGSEVDYKQKFSDSKDEGIRLLHKNENLIKDKAELEVKLAKANETLPENEYSDIPDWDLLSDNEKAMMKKQVKMEKDLLLMREDKAWNDDLEMAIGWSKENGYSLDNRTSEFKKFCYNEDNKDVKNIIVLAKSFFFEEKKEKKEHIGLEKPTGGGHEPLKKGETSTEEAARLRTSNPKLYKKMLLEGRLKGKNIT